MSDPPQLGVTRRSLIAATVALAATSLSGATTLAQSRPATKRVGILFPGLLGAERLRLIREGVVASVGADFGAVKFEPRSAEGDADRLRAFAVELAAPPPVDVILALGSLALQHARDVAGTVPIVALDLETDPVVSGAAASLARPGGNVTGIFFDAPEIAGKWLQMLSEIVPALSRVALVFDEQTDRTQLKAAEDASGVLRLGAARFGIRTAADLEPMFETMAAARVHAVLVHSSPIFVDNAERIAVLALRHRLPSIMLFPVFARSGGLISYGPDNFFLLSQVGVLAGKVLKGARPADVPIERPSKFTLAVNLKTARALDLQVPQSLIGQADEVIE